ncbi:MAG: peptidylprolyl isomerase [Fidelibacterota bacterium]
MPSGNAPRKRGPFIPSVFRTPHPAGDPHTSPVNPGELLHGNSDVRELEELYRRLQKVWILAIFRRTFLKENLDGTGKTVREVGQMGLMHVMRNRMHLVLWILLVLFLGSMTVGGLVGGADIINQLLGKTDVSQAIAVVNGQIISPDQYFRQVSYRLDELRAQGQEVDDQILSQVRSAVWQELVEMTLVDQQVEKYGIDVTENDVYYHLLNNPPQLVTSIEAFQTNGQFDREKYLQALRNPQGDEWRPIEILVRSYLPRQKLYDEITTTVQIPPEDVKREYLRRHVDFTVSALLIRASDFNDPDVNPNEEEMEDYYLQHSEEFHQEESRTLSVVRWDKKPSREDSTLALQEVEDLLKRVRAGEDFSKLANEYSQDPGNRTADGQERGGDLGWFGRGQMVKPFEEAAFRTPVGNVAGPVETDFGYHIIQVRDSRTSEGEEEVLASHILLKIETGPTTLERLRQQAHQFTFDVEDFGIQEALQRNELSLTTLSPISENTQVIPGFGFFPSASRFAFRSEPGTISDVLESDQAFAVFRLESITPAGPRPYEEVRFQIERTVRLKNQMERAESLAQEIYVQAEGGATFDQLSSQSEAVRKVGPVTRKLTAPFPEIGRQPTVTGSLLHAEPGTLLPLLELPHGFAVMFFEKRGDWNQEDWEVKRESIRTSLETERKNAALSQWLADLKNRSKIIDNRRYYF